MSYIEATIEDAEWRRVTGEIIASGADASPLMGAIAGTLFDQTEANFAAEGRPKWLGIQPRKGRSGGKVLQDTGRLAASITPEHGPDHAQVGTNVVYARIHQLGGRTRPHVIVARRAKALAFGGIFRKSVNHPGSVIPARPFLPVDGAGNLQPEAFAAVMADAQTWLRTLISD